MPFRAAETPVPHTIYPEADAGNKGLEGGRKGEREASCHTRPTLPGPPASLWWLKVNEVIPHFGDRPSGGREGALRGPGEGSFGRSFPWLFGSQRDGS